MMARTQIVLDLELQKRARRRAAELGISLAEYVRRLVSRDLAGTDDRVDVSAVFDLGRSKGADIARNKDEMIAMAVAERRRKRRGGP